jgi:hypothetical protein
MAVGIDFIPQSRIYEYGYWALLKTIILFLYLNFFLIVCFFPNTEMHRLSAKGG